MSANYAKYSGLGGSGGGGGGSLSLGNFDSVAPTLKGAALVANVLSMQSATALFPGSVNTTTQTFAGDKTFNDKLGVGATPGVYKVEINGTLKIGDGSNLGINGAYGLFTSAFQNAGLTINKDQASAYASLDFIQGANLSAGWSVQLQPSDTSLQFNNRATSQNLLTLATTSKIGVLKVPTYTLDVNGDIAASNLIYTNALDTSAAGTLALGTNNATVVNIGNAGATVNISGTIIYEATTQLEVKDPLVTLNKGGAAGSGSNSGIEIEEGGSITGYAETSASRNSWILKAPNTAGIATITPGASGITLDQSSHDPVTLGTANGLSLSTQQLSLAAASASTTGALTSTDWSTFNSKAASGANSDITSLSGLTGSISTPTFIQMSTSPGAQTAAAGKFYFDSTGTLSLGMDAGAFEQHIGEDVYIYGKATANIAVGQLIQSDGAVGASGVIQFKPTTAGLTNVNAIIGVAVQAITSGNFGRITAVGSVRGFDTTGSSSGETWADGDTLYYKNAAGGLMTNVKPTAPNQKTEIGIVTHAGSGASGSMIVKILPGTILGGTDSNVQLNASPANNSALLYDTSLQYWKDVTPSTAFNALSPITSAGDLILGNGANSATRLAIGSSGTVLASNGTTASWQSLQGNATYLKAPTVQKFTSGSGTYTTPTNPSPLYIKVKMVGAGGGGAGSGTSAAGAGGNGGNTTFGTSLLTANGGAGAAASSTTGGAGGTASLGTGPIGTALSGGNGGGGVGVNQGNGGAGGASYFGGAGPGGGTIVAGVAGKTNTGGGGGGAGGIVASGSAAGGGAGGFVDAIIAAPSATYAYAVGAAGTAGAAGASGFAGGAGGSGYIIVEEYYQ